MDDLHIEDGSNDKNYFTMVPNYILNHSGAIEQALYLQMKRFAGEKGTCTSSERYLTEQLKIGTKALKKALKYLIEHHWIEPLGVKTIFTEGGPQKVKSYRVNDIWKMNMEYYKGVSKSVPLYEGAVESDEGAVKRSKGVRFGEHTKNIRTIRTSEFENSHLVEIKEGQKEAKVSKGGNAEYERGLQWAENRTGRKFVHRVKQYAALKKAKECGIGAGRMKDRWIELEGEPFYQEKGLDWCMVLSSFDKRS